MQKIDQVRNTRSPEMWDIIKPHVDFVGKSVIDLGCGTGDFLWYALQAGARYIRGIDLDISRCYAPDQAILLERDLDYAVAQDWQFYSDIAFCFSVLPYLNDIEETLAWMRRNFTTALIECQYAGDGPGPACLTSDEVFKKLALACGWQSVKPLGYTMVKENRFKRTIWECKKYE